MQRRRFIQLGLAGSAAALGGGVLRGRSYAAPFGVVPHHAGNVMLPPERRAKRILEIFLYGGLSPWETLYTVEEYGRPDDPEHPNEQYHTFLGGGDDSVEEALKACGHPSEAPQLRPFARDANGALVKLGPFSHPLWERPDVIERMRLLVQRHRLEPHEAAVPQALTGRPVGVPSAAGLGAHIQRHFNELSEGGRASPYSYLFATGGISSDNVSSAASTGRHPGSARPLKITITNADRFAELVSRRNVSSVTSTNAHDDLMNVYVDQYRQRLTRPGESSPVRSRAFNDLALAVKTVDNIGAMSGVLTKEVFAQRSGLSCGVEREIDIPGMSLDAARQLLTHPTEPARYVCVSDVGLYEAVGGGGYDCHKRNSKDTARNFANVLRNLTAIINAPGENNPRKINLDDTLIILNTEFGRTAKPQEEGSSGRNHWPYAYVTAMIGGPITTEQMGIFGAIGPDSKADLALTPAQNRIAALLALGIWPFEQESFAVSDSPGAVGEEEAALMVTERALGIRL